MDGFKAASTEGHTLEANDISPVFAFLGRRIILEKKNSNITC